MTRRKQIQFWLSWTLANTIGLASGWMLGEFVSQVAPRLVWFAFQFPIWIMRAAILVHFREFRNWRLFDTIVWIGAELVGALFGEGARANGVKWATVGPAIGFILAPTLWQIIWFLRFGRNPGGRKWFAVAMGWGFAGFIVSTAVMTIALVGVFELGAWAEQTAYPNVSWGIAGLAVGFYVGIVTGPAIAGLLTRPISRRKTGFIL